MAQQKSLARTLGEDTAEVVVVAVVLAVVEAEGEAVDPNPIDKAAKVVRRCTCRTSSQTSLAKNE